MKFFMFLIIITIILCILNEIWPYLLGIAAFILGNFMNIVILTVRILKLSNSESLHTPKAAMN